MRTVLSVIPGPTYGGAANQAVLLHDALRARGFETVVVLPPGAAASERVAAAGIEVVHVDMPRLRATARPGPHLRLARRSGPAVRALRALIREHGAAVVVNHGDLNPHAAVAGRQEGVAVCWQILDTRTPPPLRRVTGPVLLRLADSVTSWGRELARAYPGVLELGDRHVVVFPPVALERFRSTAGARAAARAELGLPEHAFAVGAIGNRNPQKGHEWIVRAAAVARREVPGLAVRVLGAPSPGHERHEAAVRAEASERGLGDAFAYRDPGTRVPELIHAFDAVALSSVPRSEGIPTVLAEAMAAGIPVVTTDVGAARELVDHDRTGLVVPPLDADALGAALVRLAQASDLRDRLSAEATHRLPDLCGVEAVAARHARALEQALRHRAERR